jgi:hypothetical protein
LAGDEPKLSEPSTAGRLAPLLALTTLNSLKASPVDKNASPDATSKYIDRTSPPISKVDAKLGLSGEVTEIEYKSGAAVLERPSNTYAPAVVTDSPSALALPLFKSNVATLLGADLSVMFTICSSAALSEVDTYA